MKEEIELIKIHNADKDVESIAYYEFKIPSISVDDYGNEVVQYKKKIFSEANLIDQKEDLEKQLEDVNIKLDKINELNG